MSQNRISARVRAAIINKQRMSAILLGMLVGMVLLPNAPTYEENPTRDSGVFLYIGQQIVNGQMPYVDIWDHKPPMIYYINALGLLIGRGTAWGVLFLELLSLCFAVTLGYRLISQAFGILPALFASVAWLMSLVSLLHRGNFTEEFALPLQFAALHLFWQAQKRSPHPGYGFAVGVTGALAFLLKPNSIGLWLSILLFWLVSRISLRRWHSLLRDLATIALGAMSILLVAVIYFAAHGAIVPLWDQVFRYNMAYSATALDFHLAAILAGLVRVSPSGMSIIALTAWIYALMSFWPGRAPSENTKTLLVLLLIALPVEFVLVSVSGRPLAHYYIVWLPSLALLCGFFAHKLATDIVPSGPILRIRRTTFGLANICLSALLLAMSALPATVLTGQIMGISPSLHAQSRNATVEYVKNHTDDNDYVLMWGAETSVNFLARRKSPTKFVYQYPLHTRGYQTGEMIEEFLDDIATNKPALIIDSSPSNPKAPPIDTEARQEWIPLEDAYGLLPEIDDVSEYIAANYELVGTIGGGRWAVYAYVEEP
jgi:hypothetical protein